MKRPAFSEETGPGLPPNRNFDATVSSNFVDLSSSQGLMHTILRNPTLAMGSFSSECHFEIPKDIEERLQGRGMLEGRDGGTNDERQLRYTAGHRAAASL
jgi:hypothetical protein